MKHLHHVSSTITTVFILGIVFVFSLSVTTIAMTIKYNQFTRQYLNGITATVIKDAIPLTSFTEGVVKKVSVSVGDEVKKEQTLVEIDNPAIRGKITTLLSFKDNVSALTEAQLAKQSLRYFTITPPIDGVIGDIHVTEGMPVADSAIIVTVYASSNIRLLSALTLDQYFLAQRMNQITAYSPRLDQNFLVRPRTFNPSQSSFPKNENQSTGEGKKIGLYLTFINPKDGTELLNNEDLVLRLRPLDKVDRPIAKIAHFWNVLLGMTNEE